MIEISGSYEGTIKFEEKTYKGNFHFTGQDNSSSADPGYCVIDSEYEFPLGVSGDFVFNMDGVKLKWNGFLKNSNTIRLSGSPEFFDD